MLIFRFWWALGGGAKWVFIQLKPLKSLILPLSKNTQISSIKIGECHTWSKNAFNINLYNWKLDIQISNYYFTVRIIVPGTSHCHCVEINSDHEILQPMQ